MPRLPSFKVRKTPKGWLLNIPASLSDTSAKQRRYFPTRDLALAEASRLRGDFKANGERVSVLSPRVAGDAAAAWALLEPRGKSLVEAARFLIAALDESEKSESMTTAVASFRSSKTKIGDRQTKNYRLMGDSLVEHFGDRPVATISHGEILDFLADRTEAPASYNQWIRLVAAFWRWCAKQPRQWCKADLVEGMEQRETVSDSISVLTAKEAERLLRTAEKHYPECVAPLAVAIFTGMRAAEIARLLPEDITEDGIEVPATSAKTKKRRFVHMTEPLAAWLEAYPIGETVIPPNWYRKQRALRRKAGWRVWSEAFDQAEPPTNLPPWPHNALRHTAASVSLTLEKPIEILVFEHGHAGGLTTLRQHYIGRITKKDAAAIHALRPMAHAA